MKHILPNNAWAEIREPHEVSERLRRPVTKALMEVGKNQSLTAEGDAAEVAASLSVEELTSFEVLNDLLIVARVSAWSFDLPINLDSVLDIPSDAYDALRVIVAEDVTRMMPNFAASDSPDSPTSPSLV